MNLNNHEKYELGLLINETELHGGNFEWIGAKPAEVDGIHARFDKADTIVHVITGDWFSISPAEVKSTNYGAPVQWSYLSNPGAQPFQYTQGSVNKFEDLYSHFRRWLRWEEESSRHLSPWVRAREQERYARANSRDLGSISRALQEAEVSLEIFEVVEEPNRIKLSFKKGEKTYATTFTPTAGNLRCNLKPGIHGTGQIVDVKNLQEFKKLLDDWAGSVRKELAVGETLLPFRIGPAKVSSLARARIARIAIKNIRGFCNFEWTPEPNSTSPYLIIGANGTGKSTLLRCLALTLLPDAQAQSLLITPLSRNLVADREKEGTFEVTLSVGKKSHRFKSTFSPQKGETDSVQTESTTDGGSEQFFRVFGYGAGRTTEGATNVDEDPLIYSVLSLFRYNIPLVESNTALHRLQSNPDLFQRIIERFSSLVKADDDDPQQFNVRLAERGLFRVRDRDRWITMSSWADGYRILFQWYLDLWLSAFNQGIPSAIEPYGVLLIDELELHLHPRLQSRVLTSLGEAFPNLTIVATTHSPIIALGADPNSLVALKLDEEEVVAEPNVESFRGMTVEDVLNNEHLFDTTPYSPATQELLARWKALMDTPSEELDDEERLELSRLTQDLLTS